MSVKKCRSCGADVLWVVTETGKKMPLDAKAITVFVPDPAQRRARDGDLCAVSRKAYVSHFATCPDADEWRGGSHRET